MSTGIFNYFAKCSHIESRLISGNPKCEFNEEITICIPSYKRIHLLKESLKSALNQKTKNKYKVLVVDDDSKLGETDTSLAVAEFSDDKLIYYKNQSNLGLFGNMNRCAQLAQTKYISFLHDDDLLEDNYIETITKYLHRKSSIACICVAFREINSPFNPRILNSYYERIFFNIKKWIINNRMLTIPDRDNYFLHRNIFGPPTCGILFNKELFMQSGGFNEDLFPTADWFFMIDFNKKNKVYRVPEILASYRWESNTSLKPETMYYFFIHSNQIINQYMTKHKIFYDEILEQISNDFGRYNLRLKEKKNHKYSKFKMFILVWVQRFFNLRYISYDSSND